MWLELSNIFISLCILIILCVVFVLGYNAYLKYKDPVMETVDNFNQTVDNFEEFKAELKEIRESNHIIIELLKRK